MTIKEFFKPILSLCEEIEIYKDNGFSDNLITHSCYTTKDIIERYGHYKIKQFWVRCEKGNCLFVFIV